MSLKYNPIIIKISKESSKESTGSILNSTPDLNLSSNIDYPRSEFGFNHFIHASKNKLEILKKFEGKKKVYLIMNGFEKTVDNLDETIEIVTRKKFGWDKLSFDRNFYKLWEIITIFGLIDESTSSITTAHFGEITGGFAQSIIAYRKKTTDKHYIEADDFKQIDPSVQSYLKSKITTPKSITDAKCDIVTSDVNVNVANLNIYEQESFNKLVSQIIKALQCLKKGGTFVCKMYETFTQTSMKIITFLNEIFENVYFVKPLMSEMSDSEKFAVCIGFQTNTKIETMLKSFEKNLNEKSDKTNITDIFTSYTIPEKILTSILYMNTVFANHQFQNINDIVKFIKREIYFGEEYHDRIATQNDCTKFWLQTFYSSQEYPELVQTLVSQGTTAENDLAKRLIPH